ncbi:MAG: hypothetical protein AAFO29_07465 [Actinomycetota bacterium]
MTVRTATEADLDAIVALSSRARDRLQELDPEFWRRHPDADAGQRQWFAILLADAGHQVIVRVGTAEHPEELAGFVIARAMDAPPVYDPGGPVCFVDDFVWDRVETAEALLAEARRWAADRGCVRLIVVTPAADDERRSLLGASGLHATSEWWTGPV